MSDRTLLDLSDEEFNALIEEYIERELRTLDVYHQFLDQQLRRQLVGWTSSH